MSIGLALRDAQKNTENEGAITEITLKESGVRFVGKIHILNSDHVILDTQIGGWVTIDRDQIAAVESRPKAAEIR